MSGRPIVLLSMRGGGLGNQLFQYAAGFCLARRTGAELVLDASDFDRTAAVAAAHASQSAAPSASPAGPTAEVQARRTFDLANFTISARAATAAELDGFHSRALPARARRLLGFLRSGGSRSMIYESRASARRPIPAVLCGDPRRSVMLNGYFECACYVEAAGPALRAELRFRNPPSAASLDWIRAHAPSSRVAALGDRAPASGDPTTLDAATEPADPAAPVPVAIHVRGGDALLPQPEFPRRADPAPDYFARAAGVIRAAVPNPVFHLFTDDPDYARPRVRIPGAEVRLVRSTGPAAHIEDLRLMSLCRHHILTASTFGWWGAWLARAPGQLVVAPREYFAGGNPPNDHHHPADWVLM